MKTHAELAETLLRLAERMTEGWHDGFTIDAAEIDDLTMAAEALLMTIGCPPGKH